MVTALPLRGQDRLGSGQGSVQGKQWRSCHCQQREGEHVRLFIIVILIIIVIIVTNNHDPCQNLCHVDATVFTMIYRKKTMQNNKSFHFRYLYDFARDNEIDIWIGITENVNVRK